MVIRQVKKNKAFGLHYTLHVAVYARKANNDALCCHTPWFVGNDGLVAAYHAGVWWRRGNLKQQQRGGGGSSGPGY